MFCVCCDVFAKNYKIYPTHLSILGAAIRLITVNTEILHLDKHKTGD